jgi:hypothetical protein
VYNNKPVRKLMRRLVKLVISDCQCAGQNVQLPAFRQVIEKRGTHEFDQ